MPFALAQSASNATDLLDKIITFLTSKSITAATPNNHGTGYVIGDVLSVAGGTSSITATFDVVEEGAVSATISNGGTGYAVNDQITIVGGTASAAAVFNVDSVSGGVVTAVSVVSGSEGSYSATPSNPAATTNDGSGDDALTLTVTYGAIGVNGLRITQSGAYTGTNPTSPNTVTGGTGSGATIDLTLNTGNGWTVNRRTQEAVSAVVGAGGTGYSVSDQLTISGGVDVETAPVFNVDSVSSGVVTGVSLVTAGKLDEVPSNPAATTGGGGSGCTLTVTYQDLTVSGTADFNVLLEGEGDGSDSIYVGLRKFTNGSVHSFELRGMTGYTAANDFQTQPDISDGQWDAALSADQDGCYVPLDNSAITYWLFVNGRRIFGVFKVGASSYTSMHLGWINPFGTATDFPYPLLIGGCSSNRGRTFNSGDTGFSGAIDPISDDSDAAGPFMYRDPGGTWLQVHNSQGSGSSRIVKQDVVVWPCGTPDNSNLDSDNEISLANFQTTDLIPPTGNPGSPSFFIKQTPDGAGWKSLLIPTMLMRSDDGATIERALHGELQGLYWTSADISGSAAIAVSEDTFIESPSGDWFILFQNCNRTDNFTYFAVKVE